MAFLREELEKEEMYVEYLDKLLADIERHRKQESRVDNGDSSVEVAADDASDEVTSSMNDENKRRSNGVDTEDIKRSSLHLDIEAASKIDSNDDGVPSPFVTVINVSSPTSANVLKDTEKFQNLTFTKKKAAVVDVDSDAIGGSLKLNRTTKLAPSTQPRVRTSKSRESLNSVSSPTTPTSPLISSTEDFGMSPREGLGVINSSISSSNESCKELEEEEEIPKEPRSRVVVAGKSRAIEEIRKKAAERSLTAPVMSMTGSLDKGFKHRGRPDGREFEDEDSGLKKNSVDRSVSNGSDVSSKANKVRELMANWEVQRPSPPAIPAPMIKPERRSRLGSGASSAGAKSRDMSPVIGGGVSRARMGSPSGKSHDSSDSETGWIRRGSGAGVGEVSPGSTRRVSGETRLDRLVRRPSGEKSAPPLPPPNRPAKKPQAKPRQFLPVSAGNPDHLYDTVARDEPEEPLQEDEYYDNHLLYGRAHHASDTIGSGGGSSADLGFDEPPMMTAQPLLKSAQSGLSLTGSGTLSSSDTDGLSGSPSFGRENSTEDESNYVNIQYFLLRKECPSSATGQSDDELEAEDELEPIDEDEALASPASQLSQSTAAASSSASPMASRDKMPLPDASEAERLMMYKCILNSIVESEAIYLEGLSVMLQYMKAMKVTLSTQQPVIPKEDFDVIFYKIPELHDLHFTFHDSLKRQVDRYNGTETIGHNFKMLASRMKIYAAFLNNYPKALEVLHKCSAAYPQFADLTRSIKLRTVKGQKQGQSLSLEDLLHKPVARVQKHCLVLQVTIIFVLFVAGSQLWTEMWLSMIRMTKLSLKDQLSRTTKLGTKLLL